MIQGVVYFIWPVTEKHESIKIGFSRDARLRLWSLNYCTPYEIEVAVTVPGTRQTEHNIQDCFAHCHRWGEWFHPHADLLDAIERLRAGVPLEEAIDLSKRTGRLLIGNRKNIRSTLAPENRPRAA
jgi:hypothetical protein